MPRFLRHLLLVVALALPMAAAPVAGFAQEAPAAEERLAPDYAAWKRVAQRAENALEAGRASDLALEQLRDELAGWRERFALGQDQNKTRIYTLKTQISTLGPPPGEGQSEPAILTQRRAELTDQLNEAEAPLIAAEEAYSRANGLIGEIDSLVRERQTDRLLELGPTPVNPAIWPGAVSDLNASIRLAWGEVVTSWGSETQRLELRPVLPLVIVLAVVALLLIFLGRNWVIRIGADARSKSHGPARGVWGSVLSLGQVGAPLLGVYALLKALHLTGVFGLRGQVLVDSLPIMGLCIFGAAWLGNRIFGSRNSDWAILNLGPAARAEGRLDSTLLGLGYGLILLLDRMAEYEAYSATTVAVLAFPVILATGFLLFRFARLLRSHALSTEARDGPGFLTRALTPAGRLIALVAIMGPAAAAIGYHQLAVSFLFPTVLTLALAAFLTILHRFFTHLYGMVAGISIHDASEALLPTLGSFMVMLAATPVLALIWGARVTDLTELWTRVREGIAIGESVISPSDFLMFVIVFAIGYAATRLIQGMLKSTILPKTKIDIGGKNAITSGVGYVGIFLAAILAITSAGIDLSSLAIVAGALSVGIGFGLQNIVSNFVSGIILLIERPISEGDWIEVGGQMGYVRDISVRSTRIETFDRTDVVVPNSDLISGVVTNYTRGNLIGRVIVPVGVAYGTDTRKVEAVLREVAVAHPLVAVEPSPNIVFQGFGADSLDFEIRAILRDVNYVLSVKSDINHEIARRFVEEGIEIPFAQRDIWIRNAEALRGEAGPTPTPAAPPAENPAVAAREALDAGDMNQEQDNGQEQADD